jgi:hypothetical protein
MICNYSSSLPDVLSYSSDVSGISFREILEFHRKYVVFVGSAKKRAF